MGLWTLSFGYSSGPLQPCITASGLPTTGKEDRAWPHQVYIFSLYKYVYIDIQRVLLPYRFRTARHRITFSCSQLLVFSLSGMITVYSSGVFVHVSKQSEAKVPSRLRACKKGWRLAGRRVLWSACLPARGLRLLRQLFVSPAMENQCQLLRPMPCHGLRSCHELEKLPRDCSLGRALLAAGELESIS